jgi:hypothetical protein
LAWSLFCFLAPSTSFRSFLGTVLKVDSRFLLASEYHNLVWDALWDLGRLGVNRE